MTRNTRQSETPHPHAGEREEGAGLVKRHTTEEIVQIVTRSPSAREAESALRGELHPWSLKVYLLSWAERADMTLPQLFFAAGIEKSLGYKILAGRRKPGRDILLRLAFVLGMGLEDAQRLLALGERGALYARNRRDMVLIHALTHGMSLDQVQETLTRMGEASLWSRETPES